MRAKLYIDMFIFGWAAGVWSVVTVLTIINRRRAEKGNK